MCKIIENVIIIIMSPNMILISAYSIVGRLSIGQNFMEKYTKNSLFELRWTNMSPYMI